MVIRIEKFEWSFLEIRFFPAIQPSHAATLDGFSGVQSGIFVQVIIHPEWSLGVGHRCFQPIHSGSDFALCILRMAISGVLDGGAFVDG